MVLLEELRRELTRQGLSQLGRALIEDPVPGRRARQQHARNAAGALIVVASQLAWRRSGTLALWVVTRKGFRTNLGYGLAELRQAVSVESDARQRVTYATPAIAGAAAVLVGAAVGGMLVKSRRRSPGFDAVDASA